MKPTFICVGAQKAGTSSLGTHFNKHPEVFFHNTEQHFFDRDCNFTNEECDFGRGKYIDQVDYILTKFPRENVYIGIAEEIKQNPLEEYNKILTFLGAKPFDETFSFNPNIHKRKYLPESKFSEFDKKLLYEFYSPYNERLYTFLGRRIPSWDEFYVKNDLQQ